MEEKVISLYFGNAQHRLGAQGRKRQPQYFLENGFQFLEVTLPRQGFGKFWKVDDEGIAEVAGRLQTVKNQES
jgi:hypothetical protein